jgi:hypothetical protein
MKRLLGILGVAGVIGLAAGAWTSSASGQETARVRVVHASPDAPAVDVYVDGARALSNVPYKGSSDYLPVPAGARTFEVFAAGADPASDDPVIDADADLESGADYTIVAVGKVAEIRPLVLEDNNAAPASGKAHVRVIHASPDAPAVDVAVTGGPVLFSSLSFPNAAGPSPVDAGTYDLEVRAAGTTTVALPISDVELAAGKIYTVLAVGLLNGTPALEALPLVADPVSAPAPATSAPAPVPAQSLPSSGMGSPSDESALPLGALAAFGAVMLLGGTAWAVARQRTR